MQLNKDALATPLIFDVESKKRIGQFQKQAFPPPSSATSTSPTSPSSSTSNLTSPDSKESNVAAIAGGSIGAVVVVGLVGLAFWRRKAEYSSVATNTGAASALGVDDGVGRDSGGGTQASFKKEPESRREPYGHYQDGYVSPFNVRDPPTVQTIASRNPHEIINSYHEFPNDNIQRHPRPLQIPFINKKNH